MHTFTSDNGREVEKTMTVAELRAKLAEYPDDMPVMAEWESCPTGIRPENFSIGPVSMWEGPKAQCLVIDVNIW